MPKILSQKVVKKLVKTKSKSTVNRLTALVALILVSIFASNLLQQVDAQTMTSNTKVNLVQK